MSSNSRREQIVAAAARLFEENGYHTTNVAEVAEAAGISKPTLYHYFKSKEEILFEIHEEFIRYVTAKQAERMGTGLSPTDGLREATPDEARAMLGLKGRIRPAPVPRG
jgi:AcrR family transcriptional regulator